MSVIIEDMEMPKYCTHCPFFKCSGPYDLERATRRSPVAYTCLIGSFGYFTDVEHRHKYFNELYGGRSERCKLKEI